jgi:hypothetical protein
MFGDISWDTQCIRPRNVYGIEVGDSLRDTSYRRRKNSDEIVKIMNDRGPR